MIGKVIIGKSFRGCIAYCLEDKKFNTEKAVTNHRAEVLQYNLCFGNKRELSEQFSDVRKLNSRLARPVLHITLSLGKGEMLGKDILQQIVEACAKHMGFDKNQYLAVEHKDTAHQHLHIVANRVGFDGKTPSDSNSYKRIADFCRQTELNYGLQQVLSPRRFLPKELRQLPRNDSRKQRLKSDITNALFKAKSYAQFEVIIRAKGYKIAKGRGIAFMDNKGVRIKGSDVDYSLGKIERILGKSEQRIGLKKSMHLKSSYSVIEHSSKLDIQSPQLRQMLKEIATALLDTESAPENIPFELLPKKKKREKGRSLRP